MYTESTFSVIVHSLTSPWPQFEVLGDWGGGHFLSDPKFTKFWTLEPITPERFIRFGQIWLENDCGGFFFKIITDESHMFTMLRIKCPI